LAGRDFDAARVSSLSEEGLIESTPEGRLRVTAAGFPVLDAIVADLAA
ncbi:MAG TPA: coproporphyrinogen III oxidase, partial [Xanthobacteraceae bacterium]|nr:coproporphyrinogen III oxidase [Xanthobacteraceae bacterium]